MLFSRSLNFSRGWRKLDRTIPFFRASRIFIRLVLLHYCNTSKIFPFSFRLWPLFSWSICRVFNESEKTYRFGLGVGLQLLRVSRLGFEWWRIWIWWFGLTAFLFAWVNCDSWSQNTSSVQNFPLEKDISLIYSVELTVLSYSACTWQISLCWVWLFCTWHRGLVSCLTSR